MMCSIDMIFVLGFSTCCSAWHCQWFPTRLWYMVGADAEVATTELIKMHLWTMEDVVSSNFLISFFFTWEDVW